VWRCSSMTANVTFPRHDARCRSNGDDERDQRQIKRKLTVLLPGYWANQYDRILLIVDG
jgi:hypothetical protein